MDTIKLQQDFKEFLRSLNAKRVDYLLIGGYAVNAYGYHRLTQDMDVWIAMVPENARRVVEALRAFGFDVPALSEELFVTPDKIIRMGIAPVRIEISTTISGVEFEACRHRAVMAKVDDMTIPVISLADLRANKRASGRPKDLIDLAHLPEA